MLINPGVETGIRKPKGHQNERLAMEGGGRIFSNFLKCGVVDGSVETTECLAHPFV